MSLVSVYKSVQLAYRDGAGSDKIWGAALVRNPATGAYHYVAIWGKPQGKLQSISKIAGGKWISESYLEQQRSKKMSEGYWEESSNRLTTEIIDLAAKIQTPIPAPKPSIFSTGVFVAPDQADYAPVANCGFCLLWADGPASDFRNAICTICKQPSRLHLPGHPHARTSENYSPPYCGQFSLTPQAWTDYGWNVLGALYKPAVAVATPAATPAPGPAKKCLLCFGIANGFGGGQNHALFVQSLCDSCGHPLGNHRQKHPHDMLMADCKQASFKDEAYTILGVTPGDFDLSKPASNEQTCPSCAVHEQSDPAEEAVAEALYALKCEKCGKLIGDHKYDHPHSLFESCSAVQHPLKAFIRTGTLRANLTGVLQDEALEPEQAQPLKLLDLPCNCAHLLSLHDGPRVCLVATCKCEAYRRTCAECGEITRTVARHSSSCLTGLRERLSAEPTQPPVRSDFKAPRKLTLADDF